MDHQRISRAGAVRAATLSFPATLWTAVFLIAPLCFIVAISFYTTGSYGEIERPLTLEHYRRLIGYGMFGWDPVYASILAGSVVMAGVSSLLCLALALPLAFWMARLPGRWKVAAIVLVTIPLWTNLLIRTYAWQMLLAPGGAVARAWEVIGGNPGSLYPGTFAVYTGLVCDYLPFMVLPMFASVEKIDWSLAEAARDLGATRWPTFRHAIWPQIRPGVLAGVLLVFIPATGQFVIPDLLGGARTVLLGNVIQQQFGPSNNWPFGSALATAAMLVVVAGLFISRRGREAALNENSPSGTSGLIG